MQPFTYDALAQDLTGDNVEQRKKSRKKCRAILKNKPDDAAFLHLWR